MTAGDLKSPEMGLLDNHTTTGAKTKTTLMYEIKWKNFNLFSPAKEVQQHDRTQRDRQGALCPAVQSPSFNSEFSLRV